MSAFSAKVSDFTSTPSRSMCNIRVGDLGSHLKSRNIESSKQICQNGNRLGKHSEGHKQVGATEHVISWPNGDGQWMIWSHAYPAYPFLYKMPWKKTSKKGTRSLDLIWQGKEPRKDNFSDKTHLPLVQVTGLPTFWSCHRRMQSRRFCSAHLSKAMAIQPKSLAAKRSNF